MSFQQLIDQHNKEVSELQQQADQSRLELANSIEELTTATLSDISTISKQTYSTQKQIEAKSQQLHQQSQKLIAQSQQWSTSLKEFNNSIKELGDIANWCKVIEADMRFAAKALDNTIAVTTASTPPS